MCSGRARSAASSAPRMFPTTITPPISSCSACGCRIKSLADQPLKFLAEFGRDVAACEGVGNVGGEKADLGAAVEAAAFEFQAVEILFLRQRDHGVGELDLAAGAGLLRRQKIEDFRLQDVAAG